MTPQTIFDLLATPAFIALGGLLDGWWPLNIMFALLVITATLYVIEYRTVGGYFTAAAVFLVGSAFVGFWWPAVLFGLAVWWHCKRPGLMSLALSLATLASLWFVNDNLWALAAVPLSCCSPESTYERLACVGYFMAITLYT